MPTPEPSAVDTSRPYTTLPQGHFDERMKVVTPVIESFVFDPA
jgi:hypothetical protein